MQELHADKDFLDWLRRVSSIYGDAMAVWGEAVHQASGGGSLDDLLTATDGAVARLVDLLMAIGSRHDAPSTPEGGEHVLEALDQLLGASAELLREARAGMVSGGIGALATLAPRITELRTLESDVEQTAEGMRDRLSDTYGDPGAP